MMRVIFQVTTCFLALYGALLLANGLINKALQKANLKDSRVKLVLIVKNQEDVIEGIIRHIFLVDLLKRMMSRERLTVVDMSSTDETYRILTKLKNEYDNIEILKEGEKDKVFSDYEKSSSVRIIRVNE